MENVIKNLFVYAFKSQEFPEIRGSYEKLKNKCSVSGRIQYYTYRYDKIFDEIYQSIEEARIGLAREYCRKDADGNPDVQYIFNPDNQLLRNKEIEGLEEKTPEEIKKINEKYCERNINGTAKTYFTFEPESAAKWNEEYSKLMDTENVIPFSKIKVSFNELDFLNKPINIKQKDGTILEVYDPLSIQDLNNLSCILDFDE